MRNGHMHVSLKPWYHEFRSKHMAVHGSTKLLTSRMSNSHSSPTLVRALSHTFLKSFPSGHFLDEASAHHKRVGGDHADKDWHTPQGSQLQKAHGKGYHGERHRKDCSGH